MTRNRRNPVRALSTLALLITTGCVSFAQAADKTAADVVDEVTDVEPLSFGFLEQIPGRLLSIGPMRLHISCSAPGDRVPHDDGAGERASEPGASNDIAPTVLFEPGLGGSALEWEPVIGELGNGLRTCTYDRAGYGWSDPSAQPRHAARLAYELDTLIDVAGLQGPLILVAHSFGGFVARLLAERRVDDVAGMLLIDTSHEGQFERLEKPGGRPMMPRSRQFVISQNDPPPSLPRDIRRKLSAFSRMRKTYSATHGEMSSFRESALQVAASRGERDAPFPFPVTVIRRGRDVYPDTDAGLSKAAAWVELQEDLGMLGSRARMVIATESGHHVHADEPLLVADEIRRLIASRRE